MEEIIVRDENATQNNSQLPWVTVPCKTAQEKLALFAASQNPTMLKDADGELLAVTGWKVEAGSRLDRNTGSVSQCVNTTLFTQDGTAYFTQSNGVARSMRELRNYFPDGPSELPGGVLKLRSVKQKTVAGVEYRTLVPVFE